VNMSVYPREHHLSSWAGVCPGNEESAGNRLRHRTRKKNRWLRRALVEAGWAAGRTKKSYLGAQYRRQATRRGKKPALLATGHTQLVIFYRMLKSEDEYQGLGAAHFDGMDPERLGCYLVKPLSAARTSYRWHRPIPSRSSRVRRGGPGFARHGPRFGYGPGFGTEDSLDPTLHSKLDVTPPASPRAGSRRMRTR
jgi:hypothetical protein